MDGIAEITFDSWKEFKADFIDRIRDRQVDSWPDAINDWEDRRFFFRGQSCASWSLISSFDRWMLTQPGWSSEDDRIEPFYWEMLADFVANGQDMGILADEFIALPRVPGDLERFERDTLKNHALVTRLQAFGQHRGLATRLLDWSHSPYVAAFFAFSQWRMCTSKYVGVWCLDIGETTRLFKDQDFRLVDGSGNADKRQLYQRGVFSRNNSNMLEAEKLFLDSSKRTRAVIRCPALFLCKIPDTAFEEALLDLRMMRINHLSVFPDDEGLVRQAEFSLERKHKLQVPR